jgi:hypothetical protein
MTRDDRPRVGWQWSKKSPARAGGSEAGHKGALRLGGEIKRAVRC